MRGMSLHLTVNVESWENDARSPSFVRHLYRPSSDLLTTAIRRCDVCLSTEKLSLGLVPLSSAPFINQVTLVCSTVVQLNVTLSPSVTVAF